MAILKKFFCCALGAASSVFLNAQVSLAEGTPVPSPTVSASTVRQDMDAVYKAFRELQPYLFNKSAFVAPANQTEISILLETLSSRFHKVGTHEGAPERDPGFIATLKMMSELLDDTRNRFKEGNKEYSLWRIKTAANYCVTCHTRHEVKIDFYDNDPGLSGLNKIEQGEFYLATRQFDKAKTLFMQAAYEPNAAYVRLDVLRKWLLIYTRVYPNPDGAISELLKLRAKVKLVEFENQETLSWLNSLRRWKSEKKDKSALSFERAVALIDQGISLNGTDGAKSGTVEILRGSSMLHQLTAGQGKAELPQLDSNQRAEALYRLGLAYNEMPAFYLNELPELFLEQCIRESAGSDWAKKSFELYKEIVTLGFTGSAGVRIPNDVELNFKELHDLAYGVPKFEGKV